jgi:hypothetical protein
MDSRFPEARPTTAFSRNQDLEQNIDVQFTRAASGRLIAQSHALLATAAVVE